MRCEEHNPYYLLFLWHELLVSTQTLVCSGHKYSMNQRTTVMQTHMHTHARSRRRDHRMMERFREPGYYIAQLAAARRRRRQPPLLLLGVHRLPLLGVLQTTRFSTLLESWAQSRPCTLAVGHPHNHGRPGRGWCVDRRPVRPWWEGYAYHTGPVLYP